MKDKLYKYLTILGVIAFMGYGVYSLFFKVTDEIGFLGAGKVGRQVLLQTLDHDLDPNADVESDFLDHPFLVRVIVGEPLRTVIRFDIKDVNGFSADSESVKNFLAQPHTILSAEFKGPIAMQADYEVTPEELNRKLEMKNVKTMEGLLAGFGFKTLQIYERGVKTISIEIRGTQNTQHVGGE